MVRGLHGAEAGDNDMTVADDVPGPRGARAEKNQQHLRVLRLSSLERNLQL